MLRYLLGVNMRKHKNKELLVCNFQCDSHSVKEIWYFLIIDVSLKSSINNNSCNTSKEEKIKTSQYNHRSKVFLKKPKLDKKT